MPRVTLNNGICSKKNLDGSRKHDMRVRVDLNGKHYCSCERCGALLLEPVGEKKKKAKTRA